MKRSLLLLFLFFQRAESESLKLNELTIYSHGHPKRFAYSYDLDVEGDLSRILYRDSAMWRNLVDGKTKSLTMVLKAFTTGSLKEHNISQVLTNAHKGLTIYAPAQNWTSKGTIEYTHGGTVQQGWYNVFQNGLWTKNSPINLK